MLSEQIKAALPLVDQFRADGHELRKVGAKFVTLCPWHQEKTPSCYISPDKDRFHCFGCGANGTVIDYHALSRGIPPTDAMAELARRLQDTGEHLAPRRSNPRVAQVDDRRPLPRLPELETGSEFELRQLAGLRGISVDGVRLASDRGILWFCDLIDRTENVRAWLITDRSRRNAQARRMDGKSWQRIGGKKAWTLPDAQAPWPVGICEAQCCQSIAVVEGGPDLLAAFHFIAVEDKQKDVAPVSLLGCSLPVHPEALALFSGRRIRLFPHVDPNGAGRRAALNWEAQLLPIAAHVDAFDFAGLVQTDGRAVKDLNDVSRIDPSCFESERDLWAMMNF